MILKYLYSLLVFIYTHVENKELDIVATNPHDHNHITNETNSPPAKIIFTSSKKDSLVQTKMPIVIFNLINTGHSNQPAKNSGSLKNAGKAARTANTRLIPGKI